MIFEKNQTVNRLAIYFFFDPDGVVDRYVPYFLEDLKKNCSEVFVVCNGKLTPEGRQTLLRVTPNVFVRENKGFDVWAYKTALEQYGWEKIEQYDEVVFVNFTLFGPLYPFAEAFEAMREQDIDFWGMNLYHKVDTDPMGTICYGYIPDHIQSSFIVVRNSMLRSMEFHDYWENRPPINNYNEAVGKHEAIFTKHFSDCGFKWKVYIDTEDVKDYHIYPLMFEPLKLVRDKRCPVIKRKAFALDYLHYYSCSLGEPVLEVLDYVRQNLDYDVDMIWENVLRSFDMADIKNAMHFNYVLPRDHRLADAAVRGQRVALFMLIHDEDEFDDCARYAMSMPDTADLYFIVDREAMRARAETIVERYAPRRVTILAAEDRGRPVGALLVAAKPYVERYDLVCFAHDQKAPQTELAINGQSFAYLCFESVLGSRAYVENVLEKFEREKHMGMLVPPPPMFGVYYHESFGAEWGDSYDSAVELAKELGLHVNIRDTREPIFPMGAMFWFRPAALKKLLDRAWSYDDFTAETAEPDGTPVHALERLLGYVAQDAGYYVAWGMSDRIAAMLLTDYHFVLHGEKVQARAALAESAQEPEPPEPPIEPAFPPELLENDAMMRAMIRERMKRKIPRPIWKAVKKVYVAFGGRKWLSE